MQSQPGAGMSGGEKLLEAVMPKHKLISIVEDDQFFRRILEKTRGVAGLHCRSVPFGSRFPSIASTAPTACLVTDVQMPGMSGVELHGNLIDAGYAIPTILVTAYPDEAVRKRALKNGVVCYLSKPVDDEHLERCLRSALQPGKPSEENS